MPELPVTSDWWKVPPLQRPKEERPCCLARRDKLGRLPIGFCSPECVGRADQEKFLAYLKWLRERRQDDASGRPSRDLDRR